MDIFTLKKQIMETAELGALSALRLLYPTFDDVKLTEAYKIAGSVRWLSYHIKRGTIKGVRRGTAKNSPIYFSRFEIAALKKAEAELTAELK